MYPTIQENKEASPTKTLLAHRQHESNQTLNNFIEPFVEVNNSSQSPPTATSKFKPSTLIKGSPYKIAI